MIEQGHKQISVARQCALIGLARASLYYKPKEADEEKLRVMRMLDEQYTRTPFYGILRMTAWLNEQGRPVNHKRVARLMRQMGLQVIYPKRKTSIKNSQNKVYPYLLRDLKIDRPNHVWSTDITYIRMRRGFIYLTVVLDWYSRYVLSWAVSISLESDFCIEVLEKALRIAKPDIFNTDQGSQYTSPKFTGILERSNIKISMDGKGRAFDNIFVERLWRSVKYEEVYLHDYDDVPQAICNLGRYLSFYNDERLHQALGYKTPREVYWGK